MGFDHVSIPFELTLGLVLLAAARPALGADAADKKSGAVPDVLIQAEEKRPVQREKPAFSLDLKEDAPLEQVLKTEDEVKTRLPMEVAQSTAYAPGVSDSAQVLLPASSWILATWNKEPVRVFYPAKELSRIFTPSGKEDRSKTHWDLVVVDGAGKPFKRYEGAGQPPEQIEFEGKGDNGDWVRPGQVYTGVLTFQDAAGRSHTAMGKPFALAGLGLEGAKDGPAGAVLSLAARGLFDDKSGDPQLTDHGKEVLLEAAQLISRRYPGLGVEVAARLSRTEKARVQAAGDLCAGFLAKRLLRPAGTVSAKAYPATSDLEERVDLSVLNR